MAEMKVLEISKEVVEMLNYLFAQSGKFGQLQALLHGESGTLTHERIQAFQMHVNQAIKSVDVKEPVLEEEKESKSEAPPVES